jgi:hypothetical protein
MLSGVSRRERAPAIPDKHTAVAEEVGGSHRQAGGKVEADSRWCKRVAEVLKAVKCVSINIQYIYKGICAYIRRRMEGERGEGEGRVAWEHSYRDSVGHVWV